MGRHRVVEGAVIHCTDTFENNKSFSEEDNIISFYIFNSIIKSREAAGTLGDPLLSIAGTQGRLNQQNPRVGAGEVPDDSHASQRNEGPQQDLPENQNIILPRRFEWIRNKIMRSNTLDYFPSPFSSIFPSFFLSLPLCLSVCLSSPVCLSVSPDPLPALVFFFLSLFLFVFSPSLSYLLIDYLFNYLLVHHLFVYFDVIVPICLWILSWIAF